MKLRLEIVAAALPAEISEEQLARAEKELAFQVAMSGSSGARLTVRGARRQHLITLRHRQKALMANMARVMLISEVEDQARRKMDAWVGTVDNRTEH